MRATSLPAALPVAAVALPLVAAALVPLAVPSTALAERWLRPVPGEVARSFDYARATPFARGAHRGADLAARPGTTVRAACGGRVVHAGPVGGRDVVVSVSCGARRVSYLPLRTVVVRAGATIGPGTPLGTVAAGHGGLHIGVRRERDRFAYEDPTTLLSAAGRPGVPFAAPRASPPRRIAPRPWAPQRRIAPPRLVTARRPRPGGPAARRIVPLPARPVATVDAPGREVAPWPVWAGLAMLLCGATGSGAVALRRRRRAAARRLVPSRP